MSQKLLKKAKTLPLKPGVYLMKNQDGKIIYVGKAKKLKNRVASYFFNKSITDLKTQKLVSQVHDFEFMIVPTEEEALILERSLIRKHDPRFNILLRDDKDYPYIEIDHKAEWPRVQKVFRRKRKDVLHFGPFTSGSSLRSILHELFEIFPLIRCSVYEFEKRKKPCHYFHMKKCLAPCALPVKSDDYKNVIDTVIQILKGGNKDIEKSLQEKMKEASLREEYELAASYRDQGEAFKKLRSRDKALQVKEHSLDAIGFSERDGLGCLNVLLVRQGFIQEQKFFLLKENILNPEETLRAFLFEYYEKQDLPEKVLIPFSLENPEEISSFLKKGKQFLKTPERGPGKKLLEASQENAFYHLEEALNKKALHSMDLEEIQKTLKLSKLPRKIECLDISNLGDSALVGSFVCFRDLKPSKENYKIYHIKEIQNKQDDFGSIREVIRRRLKRAEKEQDLPDLFVIDGGKGQLSSAQKVFEEMGVRCDLISLAKSKVKIKNLKRTETDERVFFVGSSRALPLSKYTVTFRILTQIRDEAHRFGLYHHRKKRDKKAFHSSLLEIKGLGPNLHKKIMETFKSLEALEKSSVEDLMKVPRITKEIAKEILKKL